MAKINDKCKAVGDVLTVKILKCEVVEGKYGEEVKFTTPLGELYIGRATGDQKLGRIGFASDEGDCILYSNVDGETLTFSRDTNPKAADKPYWAIARAEPATAKPTAHPPVRGRDEATPQGKGTSLNQRLDPPAVPQPPLSGSVKVNAIDRAYAHAYRVAQKVQGKDATPVSLNAGAATLVIAYGKDGLIGQFAPPVEAPTATNDADDPGPDEPQYDDDSVLPF